MVKVKAHSGDRLNDQADKLAKEAASTAPRLNLNYMNLPDLSLVLTCDNLVVETSSRRTIKHLYDACFFHDTLQLHRHSDLRLLTEHHHIHWPATSHMLNCNTTEKDQASTSFKQH